MEGYMSMRSIVPANSQKQSRQCLGVGRREAVADKHDGAGSRYSSLGNLPQRSECTANHRLLGWARACYRQFKGTICASTETVGAAFPVGSGLEDPERAETGCSP
jgi:hypothetical protein